MYNHFDFKGFYFQLSEPVYVFCYKSESNDPNEFREQTHTQIFWLTDRRIGTATREYDDCVSLPLQIAYIIKEL
jgi:hypothetical protein